MSWGIEVNMLKIIRKNEAILRKISDKKSAWNFVTREITKDVSLAVTEATEGYYEKEVNKNNRIYYILEGTMELKAGADSVILYPGDGCFISRDTEYEISGVFKAITVNQPAFVVK